MKEIDVLKKIGLDSLYDWLNGYQREKEKNKREIEFMEHRMNLIEKAIKELEEEEEK